MSLRGDVMVASLLLAEVERREPRDRVAQANKALTHINRAIEAVNSTVFVGRPTIVGSSAASSVLMMLVEAQRRLTEAMLRPESLPLIAAAQAWVLDILGTLDYIEVFDLPKAAS